MPLTQTVALGEGQSIFINMGYNLGPFVLCAVTNKDIFCIFIPNKSLIGRNNQLTYIINWTFIYKRQRYIRIQLTPPIIDLVDLDLVSLNFFFLLAFLASAWFN